MVCAIALSAGAVPAAREIHVVARDMTFYWTDAQAPRSARRGEHVGPVTNETRMKHDFVIPEWAVETKTLSGKGETSITFSVPEGAASGTYMCTPHASMMRGTIAVE